MTCANDEDPGVAGGIVGVPPACGGEEWRHDLRQ